MEYFDIPLISESGRYQIVASLGILNQMTFVDAVDVVCIDCRKEFDIVSQGSFLEKMAAYGLDRSKILAVIKGSL